MCASVIEGTEEKDWEIEEEQEKVAEGEAGEVASGLDFEVA